MWNTTSPDGSKSTKDNVPILQANTTYTETTMNVDHYWNIGANEDGHHRQVQMPKQASDITLGAGMDGGVYYKEVSATNTRVEGFYRNASGIYQFIPSFQTGTASITSSYTTVISVPNYSYGNIYMWMDNSSSNMAFGSFKAVGGVCHAYSSLIYQGNSQSDSVMLRFGNGDQASGLNIRARASSGPTGTYQYRIVYWGT